MKSPLIKLRKLCKIQSGGTPRRGVEGFYGGNIPWAKIGDIENAENGYLFNTVETITPAGLKSINNRIFPENTILLAMYGSVGKTSIAGLEMATNQAILGLQPINPDVLCFKYLRYWLDYSKNNLISKARGVALQNISATIIKEFAIPVPPIEDQKRIVKILDKADTLRENRKQTISLLDEYLKSTFLEMFGDPVKNPKGWKVEKLGCLANEFKYGTNTISDANNLDHKMPILRIPNIIGEKINYTDLKYSVIDEKEKEKIRLRYGDLLFVRTNGNPAYIGRCAVFCDSIECGYASYLIRVRLKIDSPVKSNFIRDVISFPTYRHLVIAKAKTTAGNYNINTESLKSLKIFLPPLDLQNKFTKIVEKSESLKQKMIIQSEELENQFQALMQRAFKGAL